MNLELNDRVAFVAGATSGLGLAVARALAREGASVALAGRREELANTEAARLERAVGVHLDIADPGSVARAVTRAEEALGPIDILVLNGGGPPPSVAVGLDIDAARSAAELLLFGPLTLLAASLPGMRERGWGRVVAVGSTAIHQPIPGLTTSGMFRTALASYLKTLAEEVAKDGVTVNMVLPGRIATDRIAQLDGGRAQRTGRPVEDVQRESEGLIPIGRYGSPDEFGAAAVFLCSGAAGYITGEQLRVDGGLVRAF